MSPLASANVLPCSEESNSARLSYSFCTSSRKRDSTRARRWLRRGRVGDRLLDLGLGRQRDLGLDFPRIGVEHVAGASGRAFDLLAADEMTDIAHCDLPELLCRPRIPGLLLTAGAVAAWDSPGYGLR